MRVVIDTNVVASAIFFGGKPKEVIDRVMTNQIDAYCYYVISGDKDLLTVKEYDGIEIVTVAEFLEILKNNSNE